MKRAGVVWERPAGWERPPAPRPDGETGVKIHSVAELGWEGRKSPKLVELG